MMKKIYIILSPEGGISTGFDGKSEVYLSYEDAKQRADTTTNHYKNKGYSGEYEVVECTVLGVEI